MNFTWPAFLKWPAGVPQPNFLWPQFLWLLLLLPLLVLLYWWLMRRKKKLAVRYASLAIVKEAMGRGPGWRRHVPPLLMLLALAGCSTLESKAVGIASNGTVIKAETT